MNTATTNTRLDEELTAYAIDSRTWLPSLLVNVIQEIERLEIIIARQDESIGAAAQGVSDIELDTLEVLAGETTEGGKRGRALKYPNELARRIEQRKRLGKNSIYASLRESVRAMTRERARLSARLHKLGAYREILLTDLSARRVGTQRLS